MRLPRQWVAGGNKQYAESFTVGLTTCDHSNRQRHTHTTGLIRNWTSTTKSTHSKSSPQTQHIVSYAANQHHTLTLPKTTLQRLTLNTILRSASGLAFATGSCTLKTQTNTQRTCLVLMQKPRCEMKRCCLSTLGKVHYTLGTCLVEPYCCVGTHNAVQGHRQNV